MKVISSIAEIRSLISSWKSLGESVSFVPTMGCLHEGHLSLFREARKRGGKSVASIFVNPLQFGPLEDFNRYPRTLEADIKLLEGEGVDALFFPERKEIYPTGFETTVKAGPLGQFLCGGSRTGHFDGVLTVVLKLFQIVRPSLAFFGMKDFQQLRIIEQMVRDFHLPIEIVRMPTVREIEGLALSSRNQYLESTERVKALGIYYSILSVQEVAKSNPTATVGWVLDQARKKLGGLSIEYLNICSENDLKPSPDAMSLSSILLARYFIAARIGKTRLIDNAPVFSR